MTQVPASQADVAWSAAVEANSLEAYTEFLMAYPDSEHARAAYDRLTQVAMAASATPSENAAVWTGSRSGASSPEILPGNIMII